ncbi:O-antigen ligase family protein [Oceanimonas marisflavi]|uniref:O-antigen ligase family protein n=1 Tax=Oceanimonas marisflavi TaxID=2059724 RepID=UPI000D327925|nr:O-antigen ligase [Oceanimonas marisflavi]
MNIKKLIDNNNFISLMVFLSLALLLSTPGGSVAAFAVLLLVALVFLFRVKDKASLTSQDKLFIFSLVFMFLTVLPAFVTDGFRGRYLDLSLRFLLAVPILLLLLKTPPKASWLFAGAVAGSFSACGLAVYQYFYLGMPRVDGFLYSINFGYLACALAFLSFPGVIFFERSRWKLTAFVGFMAAVFAMLLTGTRGAYIAVPALSVLLIILYRKELGAKLLVLVAAATISMPAASYMVVPQVQQRFDVLVNELVNYESGDASKAYSSSGLRLELWTAAIAAFRQSPIYGLNYNEREALNASLVDEGRVIPQVLSVSRGHAHSEYFEILAGRGILGLIALMMLFLVPGGIFLRRAVNTQGKEKALAAAGVTFIGGFMVYGLSEAPLQGNVISGCYALTVVAMYAMLKRPEAAGLRS